MSKNRYFKAIHGFFCPFLFSLYKGAKRPLQITLFVRPHFRPLICQYVGSLFPCKIMIFQSNDSEGLWPRGTSRATRPSSPRSSGEPPSSSHSPTQPQAFSRSVLLNHTYTPRSMFIIFISCHSDVTASLCTSTLLLTFFSLTDCLM